MIGLTLATIQQCHSDKNKKVLGKMKDETAGLPVMEFAGLRSKMYSMVYEGVEKKAAKGIGRASIREMKHAEYVQCLLDMCSTIAKFNIICSYGHQVYSERVTKVALSPFDDMDILVFKIEKIWIVENLKVNM